MQTMCVLLLLVVDQEILHHEPARFQFKQMRVWETGSSLEPRTELSHYVQGQWARCSGMKGLEPPLSPPLPPAQHPPPPGNCRLPWSRDEKWDSQLMASQLTELCSLQSRGVVASF